MRSIAISVAVAVALAACEGPNPGVADEAEITPEAPEAESWGGQGAEGAAGGLPAPASCPPARSAPPAPRPEADPPPALIVGIDGSPAGEELPQGRLHAVLVRVEDESGHGVADQIVAVSFVGGGGLCAVGPDRSCGLAALSAKLITDDSGEAYAVLDAVVVGTEGRLVAELPDRSRDTQVFRVAP